MNWAELRRADARIEELMAEVAQLREDRDSHQRVALEDAARFEWMDRHSFKLTNDAEETGPRETPHLSRHGYPTVTQHTVRATIDAAMLCGRNATSVEVEDLPHAELVAKITSEANHIEALGGEGLVMLTVEESRSLLSALSESESECARMHALLGANALQWHYDDLTGAWYDEAGELQCLDEELIAATAPIFGDKR
jgi:hypothetical protein